MFNKIKEILHHYPPIFFFKKIIITEKSQNLVQKLFGSTTKKWAMRNDDFCTTSL